MELADVNEPLMLADGTLINVENGSVVSEEQDDTTELVEVPTAREAIREITAVRRKVSDLPDIPKNMNGISIILTYTLFGLSEKDIAIATGISEEQVANIKMSDAYTKFNDDIVESLLKQDQDNVRNILNDGAVQASHKIIELSKHKNAAVALSASKDILDRAGHRPADVVEHRLKLEDSLEIIHVVQDNNKQTPAIDVEYGNET